MAGFFYFQQPATEHWFECLQGLCRFYQNAVEKTVLRHLPARPALTGLTFGIEVGPLRPLTIYGQQEYIGRALNVACRLQGAIKDTDRKSEYKALVSNSAYHRYFRAVPKRVKVYSTRRRLRNIRGEAEFDCKKIEFLNLSQGWLWRGARRG
jgi:hypothetical protein